MIVLANCCESWHNNKIISKCDKCIIIQRDQFDIFHLAVLAALPN